MNSSLGILLMLKGLILLLSFTYLRQSLTHCVAQASFELLILVS